jgi:hypothetical protein
MLGVTTSRGDGITTSGEWTDRGNGITKSVGWTNRGVDLDEISKRGNDVWRWCLSNKHRNITR